MIQYIGDEIFTNTETFHFFGACKKIKEYLAIPSTPLYIVWLQLNCSSVAEAMRSTTCF